MLLAGDIGGTKLHFGLFTRQRGPRRPLAQAVYRSADLGSLEDAARHFLGKTGRAATKAVLAVAGPVLEGTSRITNLPWAVDGARLRKTLRLRSVTLLNDVEAVAAALPFLRRADLVPVRGGRAARTGNRAVIAPGTGLGEAFATWDGKRHRAFATEGGHADFAPGTPIEDELLAYLRARHGHVSVERVCSGIGIANLYRFLRDEGRGEEPPWLAEALSRAPDPVPVIVEKALDPENPCDICVRALDLFASILGAEAGNLALKTLATGGVYLGGGIPPRVLPFLKKGGFEEAFLRKGRMRDLVSQIPVHVITYPGAALLGVAVRGLGSETRTRSRSTR